MENVETKDEANGNDAENLPKDENKEHAAPSTFMDRLIAEQGDLNERKSKLYSFVNSDKFLSVEKEQRALLVIQLSAMQTYSECLNQRLIQFNSQPSN